MEIFQSPQYLDVIKNSTGFVPFHISETSKTGVVTVQGFITREKSAIKNFFTRRAIIFGNPALQSTDKEVLHNLLIKLRQELSGKAIYIEFRNLTDQSSVKEVYEANGFWYEDHLDILVDLSKSQDELWKNVTTKRRNGIRRSGKEGAVFSVEDNFDSLKECYAILQEVYSRAKLPLYSFDFFENMYKLFSGEAKLHMFTAKYEGKIIGCMLALGYKGILYDLYAGAMMEYYNKYPNDLIPWEVFLWAKSNGYQLFDFGGAGKPGIPYKVRDYKKQFGGELVNFGRFKLILNKPLYKFGELVLSLIKKTGRG